MRASDASSNGVFSVLETIVFGEEGPVSSQEKEEEDDADEASTQCETPASQADTGRTIDTLADRKLRRLQLAPKDVTSASRLPAKRYFSKEEFAETVTAKLKAGGSSWLDEARRKRAQRDGPVESAVTAKKPKTLATGVIRTKRFLDVNAASKHESRCSGVGFRPRDADSELMWSTGADKCVKLYKVTKQGSEVLSSLQVNKCPIWAACLSTDSERLLCVSDFSNLFALDLETRDISRLPPLAGRDKAVSYKQIMTRDNMICLLDDTGRIHHVDERTSRSVRTYSSGTMNKAMCFNPSSDSSFFSGDNTGELFEWDMRAGRCMSRKAVDGALNITALAPTGGEKLMVGTKSGFVSLHNLSDPYTPIKTFSNLSDKGVNVLVGHPGAHLAIVASTQSKNAVRLFNTNGKGFTYQNWPGDNLKLKKVTSAAFSTSGGWMALGNDHGFVKLWQLPDLANCPDPAFFV